jgi:hypothetical protein
MPTEAHRAEQKSRTERQARQSKWISNENSRTHALAYVRGRSSAGSIRELPIFRARDLWQISCSEDHLPRRQWRRIIDGFRWNMLERTVQHLGPISGGFAAGNGTKGNLDSENNSGKRDTHWLRQVTRSREESHTAVQCASACWEVGNLNHRG